MIGNFMLGKLLSVIIVIELKWELPKGTCLRSESDVKGQGSWIWEIKILKNLVITLQ
jgi:hypothetical protein